MNKNNIILTLITDRKKLRFQSCYIFIKITNNVFNSIFNFYLLKRKSEEKTIKKYFFFNCDIFIKY